MNAAFSNRCFFLLFLLCSLIASSPPLTSNTTPICVAYFYSPTCEHCREVSLFLSSFVSPYPLEIRAYNIHNTSNLLLKETYDEYYGVPLRERGKVPALYVGNHTLRGDTVIIEQFPSVVLHYPHGVPCAADVPSEHAHERMLERFRSFSPIAVIVAALIDSINPCALSGIIFFLSYLLMTGHHRRALIVVGLSYTIGVFLAYFLIGIGFIRFIEFASQVVFVGRLIYIITIIIAFAFSYVSFYDYFKAKEGKYDEIVLQLPTWAKKITRKTIRDATPKQHGALLSFTLVAFVVGFGISLFEFLCTGQIYLPTIIYIMSIEDLRLFAFGYLILYNLIFVSPLIFIFSAAALGVSSSTFRLLIEKNLPLVKLATAVFFFVLGVLLLLSLFLL